jgi:hypothetical protein
MPYSINPEEIKTEIENLGHTVTNISNIKQYRTKLPLSMFFVELKPAANYKDIFSVKFEVPKHKRDIAQCANCQNGHTKNYCQLKTRYMKCAGDHLTNQCHRKERSSDVQCVLCGGNHPAYYKGRRVYKDLQKKTYPPLRLKQYTPQAQVKQTSHTTRSNICSNNQTKFLCCNKYRVKSTHNQSHQQTSDIQDLKNMMKTLFKQMGTMLNLLTTVLTKLK